MKAGVAITKVEESKMGNLCESCPLKKVCDIKELNHFLDSAMPPEVFRLYDEQDLFNIVRLSNRISEHLISLLKLKVVSFKDLYFSKRKFPAEVFPSIEFVIHLAHTGLLKWGYWVRNLAASKHICEDFENRTIDAFRSIVCAITRGIPKLIKNGNLLKDLIRKLKDKKIQELSDKLQEINKSDFYDYINYFFSNLYDFCDILTYIIVSFSMVNNKQGKDKIVYVSPALIDFIDDYLQFFLQELPEKGIQPTEVCVTNPSIKNDVAYFVKKYNKEIEIPLC